MTPTHWLILCVFVMLLGYTAMARKHNLPTISMTMRDLAWNWSVAPFVAGMLIGHWFFNREGGAPFAAWGWGTGIPIFVILLSFDWYWILSNRSKVWFRYPGIYVVLGTLWGYLFWALGRG